MVVANNNSNSSRSQSEVSAEWHKTRWGLVMIFVFVLLAIVFVIAMFKFYQIIQRVDTSIDRSDLSQIVSGSLPNSPTRQLVERLDRPLYGNPEAQIVLVEFADFQCLMCEKEFPIIREVMNRYKDDLLFIFRQYPVINEASLIIGQAALCAHDQDMFWEFHDQIFLNPNSINDLDDLKSIADGLGLDEKSFVTCLGNEKYQQSLVEDTSTALRLKLRGTPTFFLNGNKIEGVVSLEQWIKVIEEAKSFLNN